jgi:hypothetical protein
MEQRGILAEHSYNELLSLLEWFHKRGPIPIIIGGWAVYFYNSYLGSIDIDLVGYSMGGMFDQLLSIFERSQGYEEVITDPMGLGKTYRKTVIRDNVTVGHVEIDACTYESDPKTFHENPEKILPYHLCSREGYKTHLDLGNGLEAYLPRKSLLLLYKIKALRDRTYDLQTRGVTLSTRRREWLTSKRDKDGSDIIALIDPAPELYLIQEEIDLKLLYEIIEEFDIYFVMESLSQLPSLTNSLNNYPNANSEKVSKWVKRIQP